MNWQKIISDIHKKLAVCPNFTENDIDVIFCEGADSEEIKGAELQLGVTFPEELVEILQKSNGMLSYLGEFILPLECIVGNTEYFQEEEIFTIDELDSESYYFFGSDAGGNPYGFCCDSSGNIIDIFHWDHDTNSNPIRRYGVTSIKDFLKIEIGDAIKRECQQD